jgi:hypothetical protein
MKLSANQFWGLIIIVLSLLFLARAVLQAEAFPTTSNVVDFPCSINEVRGWNAKTRIAYCFNNWPVVYDPSFASGTSEQDETTVSGIHIRREGQLLYVDNHPLDIGGVYETVHYSLTSNPWLLFTYHFKISNSGLISADSMAPPNMLYVSGVVYKAWKPNPLGLVILAIGVWLVLLELIPLKVHSS